MKNLIQQLMNITLLMHGDIGEWRMVMRRRTDHIQLPEFPTLTDAVKL